MLGAAVVVIFVLPHVAHSPVACLRSAGGCTGGSQLDAVMAGAFVLPAAAAAGWRRLRGKPGAAANRPPFRRRARR
jgi:hypothetical protein